jgi:DNA-binding FadR family transcriptional regulator
VSTREHRDIVDKIAAGNATAAGRALFDHVMASRERMHKSQAVAAVTADTRRHLAVIAPRRTR